MQLKISRIFLALVAVSLLAGCGQKSAGLQEGAVAPDKILFENGMKFFEKNQYIKSRLSFQTLINTYPDSEYTPVSFLSIADSYYEEAGKDNLLQSEAQYKDFIIFYPLHEMADDAQMKIAAINVRLMKPHDRDPTYAQKAEAEFKKFLKDYPDSELALTSREFLREVQDKLASGIHEIGNFYFGRKGFLASESRYKEILEKYPDFSSMDESLFKLGESLEKQGRIEEASVYYSRVAGEFPFSDYFDDAKERLVLLERPVPVVDQAKAAKNESNRREEQGFSIMAPVRSVVDVFTGGEDPYEIARRRAEQHKLEEMRGNGKPTRTVEPK